MKIQTYCYVSFEMIISADVICEIDPTCKFVNKNYSGQDVYRYLQEKQLTDIRTVNIDIGDGKGSNILRNSEGKIIYSMYPIELMNCIAQQGWKIFKITYPKDSRNLMNASLIFTKEIDI